MPSHSLIRGENQFRNLEFETFIYNTSTLRTSQKTAILKTAVKVVFILQKTYLELKNKQRYWVRRLTEGGIGYCTACTICLKVVKSNCYSQVIGSLRYVQLMSGATLTPSPRQGAAPVADRCVYSLSRIVFIV